MNNPNEPISKEDLGLVGYDVRIANTIVSNTSFLACNLSCDIRVFLETVLVADDALNIGFAYRSPSFVQKIKKVIIGRTKIILTLCLTNEKA